MANMLPLNGMNETHSIYVLRHNSPLLATDSYGAWLAAAVPNKETRS